MTERRSPCSSGLASLAADAVLGARRTHRGGHRHHHQAAPADPPRRRGHGGAPAPRPRRDGGPAVTRVLLGLGSNLGDRRAHLRDAVASLPGVTAVSDVYETDPVGGSRAGALPERRRRPRRPDRAGRRWRSPAGRRARGRRASRPRSPRSSCSPSASASSRRPGGCGTSGGVRGRSTSTCSGSTASRWTSPTSPCRTPACSSGASSSPPLGARTRRGARGLGARRRGACRPARTAIVKT